MRTHARVVSPDSIIGLCPSDHVLDLTPQAMRGWWRAFAANLTCAKACMRLETMYGVLLRGATMAECCRELEAPPVGSAAGWKRA